MEFLRFGSSIPGSYWGCCACDIIQNFKFDPKAKASIQLVNGDAGVPITHPSGGAMYVGPTYEDIFWQRIRFGTFDSRDMPNHAFIAILTEDQVKNTYGRAWLAILKKAGFEFVRTVTNSVYSGAQVGGKPTDSYRNYIFMLVRNIGNGGTADQFQPPKEWTNLSSVVPEAWQFLTMPGKTLTDEIRTAQNKVWNDLPKAKFLTEAEVEAAGAPVILGGQRIPYGAQQTKQDRDIYLAQLGDTKKQESLFSMIQAFDAYGPEGDDYEADEEDEPEECCGAAEPCCELAIS